MSYYLVKFHPLEDLGSPSRSMETNKNKVVVEIIVADNSIEATDALRADQLVDIHLIETN